MTRLRPSDVRLARSVAGFAVNTQRCVGGFKSALRGHILDVDLAAMAITAVELIAKTERSFGRPATLGQRKLPVDFNPTVFRALPGRGRLGHLRG